MSTRRIAYVNARLIDPAAGLDAPGALLTDGERIADLGPGLFAGGTPPDVQVIDCHGAVLCPGLIDLRVHVGEPGLEHRETIPTASAAAAGGGITALACLPDTEPVIDDVSGVEFIARRAREVRQVKIFCYGAATRGLNGRELADLGLLAQAGAVGFTDGMRAVLDPLVMRRLLAYARTFGLLIVQHPEEHRLTDGGQMAEGETATRLGLAGMPAAAEAMLIERDLRLLRITGGRLHIAHVSTAEGVRLIRQAKADGLPITCDTAPPYFALTDAAVGEYRTYAKLCPPLRGEADRAAIAAGVADGTIDAVASDHLPQDQDMKRLPFDQAAFGGVGLETLLPVTLDLYHQGLMPLAAVIERLTAAPARILGLSLGRLTRGGPADLTLFDPDAAWTVETDRLRSKSKNTPFDGRRVQGQVLRTVVDGRTVHVAPQPELAL